MLRIRNSTRNAIILGVLCSVAYLAVYFARNILGTVTPQIIAQNVLTTEFIGGLSSIYFVAYAIGQLINGVIGDKLKAQYMISFGLILAGLCNLLFPFLVHTPFALQVVYGATGFFLSMIYAPMSKLVAENTEPEHAPRCSLGYTLASFLGSPAAGIAAAVFSWQGAFFSSSAALLIMGAVCLIIFTTLERKGIVRYHQFDRPKGQSFDVKVLIRHKIIRYTFVSILTGVIRTSVVFWLPTYLSQHLGYETDAAATVFTVATFFISVSAPLSLVVYELLKRKLSVCVPLFFTVSAISFLGVFFVQGRLANIILMVIAILASNSASSAMWSIYCPSLRDTGMVSSATGYLDFVSYMAASVSSTLFANAVTSIGWGRLILVWAGLMLFGVVIMLPWEMWLRPQRCNS